MYVPSSCLQSNLFQSTYKFYYKITLIHRNSITLQLVDLKCLPRDLNLRKSFVLINVDVQHQWNNKQL